MLLSDVDECKDQNGGCGHNCSNTVGSYHCSCLSGYTLNTTDNTCEGKKNCVMNHYCWTKAEYYGTEFF